MRPHQLAWDRPPPPTYQSRRSCATPHGSVSAESLTPLPPLPPLPGPASEAGSSCRGRLDALACVAVANEAAPAAPAAAVRRRVAGGETLLASR